VGYVLQAWINLGFFQIKTGTLSWRMPLVIPAIISMILIASIYLVPESPRWLASKGRIDQARMTLSKLRDEPEESFEIATEMNAIELTLEATKSVARKRDLFKMGEGIVSSSDPALIIMANNMCKQTRWRTDSCSVLPFSSSNNGAAAILSAATPQL
jgi:MFS family permease